MFNPGDKTMTELAIKILELRQSGKTYRQIRQILNCSLGTLCYYLGDSQREKKSIRQQNNRKKQHPFKRKIESFIHKCTTQRKIKVSVGHTRNVIQYKLYGFMSYYYNKLRGYKNMTTSEEKFTVDDIIQKFGATPVCYLTGELIDITKSKTYEFDHIIPRSRGGTNNIDNLGICSHKANRAKSNMTPDEFVNLCKKVLQHQGYKITK